MTEISSLPSRIDLPSMSLTKEEAAQILNNQKSEAATLALKHLETLDQLIDLYISPIGKISINGIYKGRVVYRAFSPYTYRSINTNNQ